MRAEKNPHPLQSILIIDDSPLNIALLRKPLAERGFRVTGAKDGTSGTQVINEEKPDLILLDITLPGEDGLSICQRLKLNPQTASIPVIFVTGHDDAENVARAFASGGSDYITKPFVLSEVIARVTVHLEIKRVQRELFQRNQELETLARQLADLNSRLSEASRRDPLTHLLNRRAWQEAAELEAERSQRTERPFSIVMMDIDHFKRLNDTLGHDTGDKCLKQIGETLTQNCRSIDVAARWGGEEFVLLLPETGLDSAVQAAERLRLAVVAQAIPHPASPAGFITFSAGVASARESWKQALKEADEALYNAKRTGRARVCSAAAPAV